MARHYAKTPAVRRTILEACFSAFAESGFHGASMAEIARRAGISHTGLLHHFPRKEDLLAAVLELQDERGAAYLREHGSLSADVDPVQVLRGMIAILVERDRHVGLAELGARLSAEAATASHPAHPRLAERYRGIRRFLGRLYGRLRAAGRLRTDLPDDQLAAMTVALTEGLNVQWLYEREGLDVDRIVRGFLDTFVRDL